MAYVDLNPVRAGLAADLNACEHTSVKQRIEEVKPGVGSAALNPVAGPAALPLPLDLRQYLTLVDLTGRIARPGKRGMLDPPAVPLLQLLGANEAHWHHQVFGIETCYWRAIGAVDALLDKARQMGQRWLKGCGAVSRVTNAH